ncbi:ectoine/hydroxyectoine ABC transporter permease subunit EhuC [Pseudonocardiaceae bacterium YIM PH 21723]|nr:ectoine/hydroxyectoine ABC transporter permease subunit EhuC [Pseudonocardiaceae bacterium YIM PH 21723]
MLGLPIPLWQRLADGLAVTLQLTVFGALLAAVFAFLAGFARISRLRLVRGIAFGYTEAFRGLPALVVLFWLVFALPSLGWQLDPLAASVIAVALNIGAYGAEVVRSALAAIPPGQWDAATAVNLSRGQTLRMVILPQAVVTMIPSLSNLLIELLKATALVSLVYVQDLTFQGQIVRAATGKTAAVFLGLLLGYGLIALVLSGLMRALEHAAGKWAGRVVNS